jgi:hypothetical protein
MAIVVLDTLRQTMEFKHGNQDYVFDCGPKFLQWRNVHIGFLEETLDSEQLTDD